MRTIEATRPGRTSRTPLGLVGLALAGLIAIAACGGSGSFETVLPSPTTRPASTSPGEPAPTTMPVVTLPSTGGGGLSKPACELLAREEVAQLAGNSVAAPTASGEAECFWGVGVDGGTNVTLRVVANELTTAGTECAVERGVLDSRGEAGTATVEEVPGVGEEAVWAWEQVAVLTQGHFLACWDDAVILVFLSGESGQTALRNVAQGIAETVRARL